MDRIMFYVAFITSAASTGLGLATGNPSMLLTVAAMFVVMYVYRKH